MDKAERLQEFVKTYRPDPTIDDCKKFLDKLDKPKLDPQHRKHLQLIVKGRGCFVKVDGNWQKAEMGESTFNGLVGEMIDLGLLGYLDRVSIPHTAGMTEYAYVTKAGIEALKR